MQSIPSKTVAQQCRKQLDFLTLAKLVVIIRVEICLAAARTFDPLLLAWSTVKIKSELMNGTHTFNF